MSKSLPTICTIIRPATTNDLPQILAIHNHAITATTAVYDLEPVDLANRQAWYEDRQHNGFPILIASPNEDSTQVLGYATYGPFCSKAGYVHTVEHSVYVRPGETGRGVGSKLLTALLEYADRVGGVHTFVARIDAANEGSLKLHDRFGFERVGLLRQAGRKFDRWLDVVVVQRLAPSP